MGCMGNNPATFIDCCSHGISAATVGKALIDKANGSRRKLEFVINIQTEGISKE